MRTSSTVPKTVVSERCPVVGASRSPSPSCRRRYRAGPSISVAALLQVCLKKQLFAPRDLDPLLALNPRGGSELKGTAGGQPGLEKGELNSSGRGVGGSGGCGCHIPHG